MTFHKWELVVFIGHVGIATGEGKVFSRQVGEGTVVSYFEV